MLLIERSGQLFNVSVEQLPSVSPSKQEWVQRLTYYIVTIFSIVYVVAMFYYALKFSIGRQDLAIPFVGLMIIIYFLNDIYDRDSITWPLLLFNTLQILIAIGATAYLFNFYFTTEVGITYSNIDLLIAAALLIPIIYGTYDAFGLSFSMVVFFALIYAYFGPFFPGIMEHSGFDLRSIVRFSVLERSGGVFGSVTQLVATWVAIFLIFAGFIDGFEGQTWITDTGRFIGQHVSSGSVQTAIISSLGFGMLSGSGAANSAVTGSFTIPLMINTQKLKKETAAAIEAVASAGGNVTPPIMGAAIFIMANILDEPLADLLIYAAVAVPIFYIPLSIAGHVIVVNQGERSSIDEAMSGRRILWEGWPFLVPLIVMIYLLMIARWGIMISGLYSTLAAIITGILFSLIEGGDLRAKIKRTLVRLLEGMRSATSTLSALALMGASVGIVLKVLTITALSQSIGLYLLDLAGGSLPLLLILTLVLSIILGMGAPPVAAYLITAVLLAPSLIKFGIDPLHAHFFVLYSSILSYISPPVALSVAITSSIAEARFITTAFETLKLGIPLFFLPFLFIFYNLIPIESVFLTIVQITVLTTGFSLLLTAIYTKKRLVFRAGLGCVSGALLIIPSFIL